MSSHGIPIADAPKTPLAPEGKDMPVRGRLPARIDRVSGILIVWALIAVYIIFFGTLTVTKHNAFQTTAFDLGNVDQAVWNTRHGRPFRMTNIEGLTNRLGTHVEPILLPISLLYLVWSDPRVLLLLQTIVIALGAWPLYLLSRRVILSDQNHVILSDQNHVILSDRRERRISTARTTSTRFFVAALLRMTDAVVVLGRRAQKHSRSLLSLTLVLAYLLFPALQSANAFDFHAVALAPTFFLFALYFLETERWGWFALFVVLTMSCKEDMPLLVAMLGLYALVVRRNWRAGLATVGVAGAWFVVAVGWIMPHFDTQAVSPFSNRYDYLGNGPAEMAVSLVTQPGLVLSHFFTAQNLAYLRDWLVPAAFLSLLAPQILILAAPTLAINLLSTESTMHQLEGFHYGAILAPIAIVAAAYGAAWLLRRMPRFRLLPLLLAAAVLAASLLYHRGHGYTPLAAGFSDSRPQVTAHDILGEAMARTIPAGASLAALPYLNPHASQRQQLYMIDRVENGLPAPLHDADYVWLDVTKSWPLHPNDLKTAVQGLLTNGYGIDQAADGWLLLRRGAVDKTIPDAFYEFARSIDPEPQYPMDLQFLLDGEPILECLGFDVISTGQPPTASLRFYWRALRPLPPGLRLYPFFFDDATGQVLEDTSLRPMIATVWYPLERWQPGEIVRTSTLPWDVGRSYSIGLGVVQGSDWGEAGDRLAIHVQSSAQIVRLFDDDTWARLLRVEEDQPVSEPRVFDLPTPQHPLDVDFGGQIRLLGYNLGYDPQTTSCALTLYWQAQGRMQNSYTSFAQLVGPAGNVRAQVDTIPREGGYPTTWWMPGEVVADSLTLELPPGTPDTVAYRLIAGWYDPATGVRLPVAGTGAGSGGDYVELETLPPADRTGR